MANEETTAREEKRGLDRGSVMVIAALAMTALLLFAALAIDVGAIWSSRTQSQNADDSAALAAAKTMIVQTGTNAATVDLAAARTQGALYAGANATVREAVTTDKGGNRFGGVTVTPDDFVFGTWNLQEGKLHTPDTTAGPDPKIVVDSTVDLNNPSHVTGVRVKVRMDDVANKKSPSFLARLLGISGFGVTNMATGYLGFAGDFAPGAFNLPVAMNSCDLSTGGCGSDFCATVSTPPNPCALKWAQGGGTDPVTCLDFSSTGVQNACWTAYSGTSPSINNPVLQSIVDNGNPGNVHAGDRAYLDNGDKDATLQYMRDQFYGCKNNGKDCGQTPPANGANQPRGEDRYKSPNPAGSPGVAPAIDSWVVKLPVFECQAGVHCSGGGAWKINGGVCFQIREILAPGGDYNDPSRLIKGKFLCPQSADADERALFDLYCRDDPTTPGGGQTAPGGCDFGIRADKVVLVQ
jgi:Flp pilus assembly protein TadG